MQDVLGKTAERLQRQDLEKRSIWRFGAWVKRLSGTVRNQVEGLKHNLADQGLAHWRPHDTVRRHGAITDANGQSPRHWPDLRVVVCTGHADRAFRSQTEGGDHVLRQDEHGRPSVHNCPHGATTDIGFLSVPSCIKAAINDILQLDVYYDSAHG